MNFAIPDLKSQNDNFAWTVLKMGGLQVKAVPFREEMRLKFFGGSTDITRQVTSFVRRGFIQINVTTGNRVIVVFPGEPGWIITHDKVKSWKAQVVK